MNKFFFNILLASLAIFCLNEELQAASISAVPAQQQDTVQVEVWANITEFFKSNPSVYLKQLKRNFVHVFGERVNGDSRMSTIEGTNFINDAESQSVITSSVTYPESENSTVVITCVEICFKGNYDADVYVIEGGIGQRAMTFLFEAPVIGEPFDTKTVVYGIVENH